MHVRKYLTGNLEGFSSGMPKLGLSAPNLFRYFFVVFTHKKKTSLRPPSDSYVISSDMSWFGGHGTEALT